MEIGSFLGLTNETVLLVSVPIVLVMITAEVVVGSLKHVQYFKRDDMLGTLGMLIGNQIMTVATKGLFFAALIYAYQYRVISLSDYLPPWLLFVVALFIIDLAFYVWHRAGHEVRFLWASHLCHHSSEEMNFTVAFRQPVLAPLLKIPFFALLPIAGLDPSVIVVVGTMATFWGVVGHTQIIPKLGILEWFLNTPSAHRVHHGINPQYIDKNYANVFIFIDRLLGTYEPEVEPVRYGLVTPAGTNNPITLTLMEYKNIWRDLKTARSLGEAFCYVFARPGWKPKDLVQAQAANNAA